MRRFLLICGISSFFFIPVFSQPGSGATEHYRLHLHKAAEAMQLDGRLDEPAWERAETAAAFTQNFPFDTSLAALQTEVKVTFDDNFLYVGAVMTQERSSYIIASLKRDFEKGDSDEFAVNIDPFQDQLNGFHFAVSPYNTQREGLINEGNTVAEDWDNKWYSEVQNYDDHWVVEMALPFKTLRYKVGDGENIWRINFSRLAVKENESSTWVPVSRQFDPDHLAFTASLIWNDPPPKPGVNISLIPYVTARTERDYEFDLPNELGADVGGDAKIAITPSLNLDLTINPDFSQVEVDRQITNLSRFELFFPERRQFFLENEDLFARFGFPTSRPFFSRRIGLARGTLTRRTTNGNLIEVERTVTVPIIAGARLSGKLDRNWRLGLLNMQTAKVKDIGQAPANYSVGVLQRRIFARSTIGAVFVNKENFIEEPEGGYRHDKNAYNRVAGLEYNLYSKDNKWSAEVFYHRSFTAGEDKDAQAAAVFLGHFARKWRIFMPNHYIGSGHTAEVGFIPRKGFFSTSPGITYNMFPRNPKLARKVIQFSISQENEFIFNNPDQKLSDRTQSLGFSVQFPGQSSFELSFVNQFILLTFPFDPTNSGGEELAEGSDYTYSVIETGYNSDVRKKLFFDIGLRRGGFFNGDIWQVEGSLSYRLQPFGIFAISYAYNDIQLPDPYNSADFWLVGPRAELSFSKDLFFSAFLQYNTQANNVNINSRLQWRFRPVSDVFLVYTDNYFSNGFFSDPRVKNRALVLKVTYWLNL